MGRPARKNPTQTGAKKLTNWNSDDAVPRAASKAGVGSRVWVVFYKSPRLGRERLQKGQLGCKKTPNCPFQQTSARAFKSRQVSMADTTRALRRFAIHFKSAVEFLTFLLAFGDLRLRVGIPP